MALRLVPIEADPGPLKLVPLEPLKLTPLDVQGYPRAPGTLGAQMREAERTAGMTHAARPIAPPTATWSDVLGAIPGQVRGTLAQTIAGLKLQAFEELAKAGSTDPSTAAGIQQELGVLRDVQPDLAATPNTNFVQRGVQQAATSAAVSAPALIAGLLTRNPELAAAAMYPGTEAQKYGELRGQGVAPEVAGPHSAVQGGLETATELLPFGHLLATYGAGLKSDLRHALGFIARELPGETVAQLGQGADDYIVARLQQGDQLTPELMTQALQSAAQQLPETWVATVIAGAAQSAPVAAANRVTSQVAPSLDAGAVAAVASQGVSARGTRLVPLNVAEAPQAPTAAPETTSAPPSQPPLSPGPRTVPGTGGTVTGSYDVVPGQPRRPGQGETTPPPAEGVIPPPAAPPASPPPAPPPAESDLPPMAEHRRRLQANARFKLMDLLQGGEKAVVNLPHDPEGFAKWWGAEQFRSADGGVHTNQALGDFSLQLEQMANQSLGPQFIIEARKGQPNVYHDPVGYLEHWSQKIVEEIDSRNRDLQDFQSSSLPPALERLKTDPELRRSFEQLKKETGWEVVGGRSNNPLGEHRGGEKSTAWIPRYPWYQGKPTTHTEAQVQSVIDKALAGKRLGKQEQVLANWLADVAADRIKSQPFMPDRTELTAAGLDANEVNANDTALVSRAAEIDETAVERAAIQHGDDREGFLRAIRDIVDRGTQARAGVATGAGETRAPAAINRDLFAGSDKESEALARRNALEQERLRREGKLTGDVPVETGKPGDLFSQARNQIDLTDVTAKPAAPGGKPTPEQLGEGNVIHESRSKRLYIAACGKRKNPAAGLMDAEDRYVGANFSTLATMPKADRPDVMILSAKFGFIGHDTQIPDYNEQMTEDRADAILDDHAQVMRFRHTMTAGYDEVFFAGGEEYRRVVLGLIDNMEEDELNVPPFKRATGGIGEQKGQIKAWLIAGPESEDATAQDEPYTAPPAGPLPAELKQQIEESYSADTITSKGTIRKPVEFEGRKFVATEVGPGPRVGYYEAVPLADWTGETPVTPREQLQQSGGHMVPGYTGLKVKHGATTYVLGTEYEMDLEAKPPIDTTPAGVSGAEVDITPPDLTERKQQLIAQGVRQIRSAYTKPGIEAHGPVEAVRFVEHYLSNPIAGEGWPTGPALRKHADDMIAGIVKKLGIKMGEPTPKPAPKPKAPPVPEVTAPEAAEPEPPSAVAPSDQALNKMAKGYVNNAGTLRNIFGQKGNPTLDRKRLEAFHQWIAKQEGVTGKSVDARLNSYWRRLLADLDTAIAAYQAQKPRNFERYDPAVPTPAEARVNEIRDKARLKGIVPIPALMDKISELAYMGMSPTAYEKLKEESAASIERKRIKDEIKREKRGGGGVSKMAAPVAKYEAGAQHVPLIQTTGAATAAQTVTLGARAGDERTLEVPTKPIRREHVMEDFQRAFGVKVYQGRPFKVRTALGFFRPKNYEVRIKAHNDLEVTAHEVFHWLDRTFPTIRRLYHLPKYRDQLKSVSYDKKQLLEGFAEFGRLYMTQESQAAAKVPEFYDAFVAETRKLGIYDKLKRVQDEMHQWYAQGAEARALSKIGPGKPSPALRLARVTDRASDRLKTWALDFTHPAKMIEAAFGANTAKTDATDSIYKQLRLLQHANSTVEAVLNYGTPIRNERGELEFSGKGLREIFEPVAPVFDDAMAYFVGRRANELRGVGKERLFSADEIRALLAKGNESPKAAEIRQAFDEYQAFNERMLNFAVQSGLIAPETRALWQKMYQNYVPFQRLRESLTDPSGTGGGRPFARLFGGTQNLRDVWQNMVDNAAMITQASLRNDAKRNLYRRIESQPKGQKYAVAIGTDTKQVKVAMTQVETNLRAMVDEAQKRANDPEASDSEKAHYAEVAQALDILTGETTGEGESVLAALQSQATFFLQGQPPGITDKDFYLQAGKPQWFQVGDPLLWDMLQEFNTFRPLSAVEKTLAVAKRTLTRGVTAAPEFQIVNFLRDTYNAFVFSEGGQVPLIDGLRAVKDVLTTSKDMQLFFLNGGAFGLTAKESGETIKLELERLRKINGEINIHAILDTPAKLADLYDKFSQTSELATRVAEFKKMRQKGASLREAAYQANEISTDFAARGTSRALNSLRISVPFFGARLQGLGRIGREAREHPLRLATRALLGITIPTMLLYWRNEDDDRYKSLTSETRSLYWVILDPSGDGVYLIPKPFEIGALFATMPERSWESFRAATSQSLVDATKFTLMNTFAFNPIPQLIRPPIELLTNYDFFRDSQIVPDALKGVAAPEQFTANTPRSMVAIGKAFGVSPIQVEHLVRGYLGTLGAYAIAAADSFVSTTSIPGEEPTKKLSQYPIAGRLRRQEPYSRTQWEQDFYRMLDESREVVQTANHMRATLRPEDMTQYLAANEPKFARARALEKVKAGVNQIDDAMKVVRFDPTLSGDEKRRQLDELKTAKNQLFKDVTAQLKEAMP